MLDPRRLRLLADLARLGTIAAVAHAHTYTPSAVSQQLSTLEREAGVPLLERSGRTVALTTAGQVLARHAEAVWAALEQTSAALAALTRGLSGPLRIGAFPTAVRTLLPAALTTLSLNHPALELRVTELDPVAVPAALLDRTLDIGLLQDYDIVPSPPPEPTLDSVPLLDETLYLAVPHPARDHPTGSVPAPSLRPAHAKTSLNAGAHAEGLGHVALRACRELPWILATPGTLCHTATLRICHGAGFQPQARHHADDFETVLALVAAGLGVALVPQLATPQRPSGVRLIPLASRRRTRIAYRLGAAEHPAVTAFVAALRAAAAGTAS
jgi:DNA-binding transcriptional LysR family regulator